MAVHVFELFLGDLLELRLGDLADLILVRLARTLFQLDHVFDHDRGRRGLDHEIKGTV